MRSTRQILECFRLKTLGYSAADKKKPKNFFLNYKSNHKVRTACVYITNLYIALQLLPKKNWSPLLLTLGRFQLSHFHPLAAICLFLSSFPLLLSSCPKLTTNPTPPPVQQIRWPEPNRLQGNRQEERLPGSSLPPRRLASPPPQREE